MAWRLASSLALIVALSCSQPAPHEPAVRDAGSNDGGVDCGFHPSSTSDSDGDGIFWLLEANASGDIDGDGLENQDDPDSDGDGVLDRTESGQSSSCDSPIDTDEDEWADFLDLDSDNDGVPDGTEVAEGSDRLSGDTDSDGCPDAVERTGTECLPTDLVIEVCETSRFGDFFRTIRWDGPGALDSLAIALRDADGVNTEVPVTVDLHSVVPADGALPDGEQFSNVQPGTSVTFRFRRAGFPMRPALAIFRWAAVDHSSELEVTGGRIFFVGEPDCGPGF